MDQDVLVRSGIALLNAMDSAGIPPRVAMWVHSTDTDSWNLWIVPPPSLSDKHAFYRRVAEIISANRAELAGLDVSIIRMVPDTHPAMRGIGRFLRAPGTVVVRFLGNRFDGFYLPEGIILRSNL